MKVRVRDLSATCVCDSTEFKEPHGPPFTLGEIFVCAKCQRCWEYYALLDRIGEEAARRAEEALESLRRNRPKKKA